MATTKFNQIVVDVSRILKAQQSLATDDVLPYTSALLSRYVNKAVREFLTEQFMQLGEYGFQELFPQYVKTSGTLTLLNGVITPPSDSFKILELKQGIKFFRVPQKNIESVRTGTDKEIVPSATRPVFWEENGLIYTLGLTSGNPTARYIVAHQDIAPITSNSTNGNFNTAPGTWTASTRTLSATMNVNIATADINKPVMFRSSTITYFGFIESRVSNSSFVVRAGDGLPAIDIATVAQVIVVDTPDASDLKLNDNWFQEIMNRSVTYAITDSKNTQLN